MTVKVDGTKGLLQNYDYLVPTTGFTYTFTTANGVILNPAATLATGTVVMPASPVDGMTVTISSTKDITTFTVSGSSGQTVSNAITTLLAGGSVTYLYRSANTTWFPFSDASNQPVLDLAKSISIGWGQTWQDVTSSRAASTTYQNTTGKPISFAVAAAGYNRGALQVSTDGVNWVSVGTASDFSSAGSGSSAIVPNTNYYRFTAGFSYWSELR